jgi:ribonuclease D
MPTKSNKIHYFIGDLPSNLNLGKKIAIDTETTGLSLVRDRLCLVQISNGDGNAYLVHFPKREYDKAKNLKKLLDDEKVQKIFHFARLDLAMIKKYLGLSLKNVFCTKIASRLARTNTEAHSFKAVMHDILGIDLPKEETCSDWGALKLSPKQLDYAANDVFELCALQEKLAELLKRENRTKLAQKCFDFLPTLIELDLQDFQGDIFAHHQQS